MGTSTGLRWERVTGGEPRVAAGVALLVATLLAAGCAHYQARPLSAAATLDELETRRLDAPDLVQFLRDRLGVGHWPPAEWDLPSLALVALYYSPELDVARARWGVTRAGEVTAGARPNPSLSVSEGYNATSVDITPWIPEIALSLPLETAGKRGIRLAEARSLSEAARLQVLATAWQVRSRLRRAALDLVVARETASLLDRQRSLLAESVRLLEAQLAAGGVSANEVTQARIALGHTQLAALAAIQDQDRARVALAGALGVPTPAVDGVTLPPDRLLRLAPTPPAGDARRRALVSHLDILSGLAEYETSEAALRLEVAKQYPDLDIGGGYQLDQTDGKWTLGIGLTLPILNRNSGPIAEAEAARTEAAARFLALQARVLSQVDSAVASCAAATATASAAHALIADLQERQTQAAAAYGVGGISALELVSVKAEVAAGELARLGALARAQQAAADLEDAMQSPLDLAEWVLETPLRPSTQGEPGDE